MTDDRELVDRLPFALSLCEGNAAALATLAAELARNGFSLNGDPSTWATQAVAIRAAEHARVNLALDAAEDAARARRTLAAN